MVELSCIKGLENNCQNKTSLWTDFKNSFAWLTGMKKLIFGINNFFGSGHFLIYFFWKKWSKNDRSKKIFCLKKSVFSYISNAQQKFCNPCLFSHFLGKSLIELSSTNFKAKILKMAFFNSEFLIVSVVNTAPKSPTTLVTLMNIAQQFILAHLILFAINFGVRHNLLLFVSHSFYNLLWEAFTHVPRKASLPLQNWTTWK